MKFTKALAIATIAVGAVGPVVTTSLTGDRTATVAAPAIGADAYHATVREQSPLDGYTMYRPLDGGRYPVVVWGIGGCRGTNEEFHTFLGQVAAHGFVVLAVGDAASRYPSAGDFSADVLTDAIHWAADLEADADCAVRSMIDDSAIAVMGQSCGAVQAWSAASDPAVDSFVSWNGSSGLGFSDPAIVAGLHTPTMIVTGGETDLAYAASLADCAAIGSAIPVVYAENTVAGHSGIFHGQNDAAAIQSGATPIGQEVELQASELAVAWLDATLTGDRVAVTTFLATHSDQADYPFWKLSARGY